MRKSKSYGRNGYITSNYNQKELIQKLIQKIRRDITYCFKIDRFSNSNKKYISHIGVRKVCKSFAQQYRA